MTRDERADFPGDRRDDDLADLRGGLPSELAELDADIRAYAESAFPEMPTALAERLEAAVSNEPQPTPVRALAHAVRRRSFGDVVSSYRSLLRSAFGPNVPVRVRLPSMSAALAIALVLATGATFGAAGASEVVRHLTGAPPPSAPPEMTFKPTPEPTATAHATASPRVHVVAEGETLIEIAGRYGVTLDALIAANAIENPDVIQVGQRLVIPDPADRVPEPGDSDAPGGGSTPGGVVPSLPLPSASVPVELP
jgi:LysM repeat protein